MHSELAFVFDCSINSFMKIAIIGGGTAGFISALILKQTYPDFQIDIIHSPAISTIGVGEGTTEHWHNFMEYVGISNEDLVQKCGATYKSGIMFKGWSQKDFLHSIESSFTDKYGDFNVLYAHCIANNLDPKLLVNALSWNSLYQPLDNLYENIKESPVSQYHFDTHRLNDFLHSFAREKGCSIIEDTIENVEISQNGIEKIIGNREYVYDFYVDCTGFKKLLITTLGATWQDYSKFLKVKEAITFQSKNHDYPMHTLAQAMNNGWLFSIPVQGRKGNGYIFDSDFCTREEAEQELFEYLGERVEIKKHIKFQPGKLNKTWIKNCCAMGLSASFVEPLEATSIGTTIQQSFALVSKITNYNQTVIDRYNNEVDEILINIRDFIILHYLTSGKETDFWKAASSVSLPDTLVEKINLFENRIPIDDDCLEKSGKILFWSMNYFIVMYCLGLLNTQSISKQYNNLPNQVKNYCSNKINEIRTQTNGGNNSQLISHKAIIEMIKAFE